MFLRRYHYLEGYVCSVLKFNGNKLPLAVAYLMASHSNMTLYDSIYLQHTSYGSSMTERLYYQPSFSGMGKPADYVIADDVYTTGKTLKSLKNYIESKGGNVISAWCIGSGPSLEFEPKRMLLRLLTAKFPTIYRYFDLNELTSPQIHYLLRLSSLNKLWMIHADNQLSLMLARPENTKRFLGWLAEYFLVVILQCACGSCASGWLPVIDSCLNAA